MGVDKKQRFGFRLLEMAFGALLLLSAVSIAEVIEETAYPVVKDFEITSISEVDNGVRIKGIMDKVRDCEFISMSVYAKRNLEQHPMSVEFSFDDDSKKTKSRAAIPQQWGPWTLYLPNDYLEASISIYTIHSCHSFYKTTTHVSDFTIERSPNSIQVK